MNNKQKNVSFDDVEILVELLGSGGVQDLSRINRKEFAERSAEALSNAMSTIREMAEYVVATMQSLNVVQRPDSIEINFGLKLTSDAKALVASASAEAQIGVKLIWVNTKVKDFDSD
ncbi:MAG: hypothetical protein DPW16_11395 [Chloroflexi bacterium]|nr:hypothetical protein [Chloroflexota bacterium]